MHKVLIVDDQADIRRMMNIALGEDFDLLEAEDGLTALDMVRQHRPDVVLLDVMMPDGSGIDVCNELRAHPETTHIPIMIMSAHAKDHEVVSKCDADEFISKPFDIDVVLSRIENLLVASN